MGCLASKSAEELRNAQIAKQQQVQKRANRHVLRLLLLGAGDSGKSTIFKQMRILYGEGYGEEKRVGFRLAVHNNLISGAQSIVSAANSGLAGSPLTGEAKRHGDLVMQAEENEELTEELAHAIAALWRDDNFQQTWEERSKYQVLDGWEDFATQCQDYPKWGGPDWIPSVADAIRARVRTSGIVEEKFVIDGIDFVLMDVGGQRNERRKWIHCFQGVAAVIFVAAISEYDQVLFEARDKNRLQEAIELFESICNSEWFNNTSIVLFLNKSDLFRYKYCEKRIPINVAGIFPDAPDDHDYENGAAWMRRKFLEQNKDPKRTVFAHITCAHDTNNVQVVFDACKESILRQSLEKIGLME
ncbi:Guanine nucleotide-binding protein alpha-17 subunit (Odorant response abnormal protein 3) [Durusdinium trenchii]|uniref:Guanine nucleotide-binding protein alpha-17 subunit (Odorant response abnormal protein 3) n=1 Tax=Durusdinium trenchii TaxID=1381693 RepID=A0ABP0STT9_9DINO